MNRILIAIALLFIAALVFALAADASYQPDKKEAIEKKVKPRITVSKETTYIAGPLDKDGYIDYETALNEKLGEGMTADNNAVVLLFKAFGPHPEGSKIPEAFFKWLKIAVPPEKGDYFVGLDMKKHFKLDPQMDAEKFEKLVDKARARAWTAKEHPELAAWLKLNAKPLAVTIEASKRPRYFYPLVAGRTDGKSNGLFTSMIPGVQICRSLATALMTRAMLHLGEQRYDEAWQDLLACHRLGRVVGQGGTLIEALVSVAIDNIAAQGDLAYLDTAKLDAKKIKACLTDLRSLPPLPVMADKVDLTERYCFLESVTMLDRNGPRFLNNLTGGPQSKEADLLGALVFASVGWEASLRVANPFYTRMSGAMRLKQHALRAKQLHQIELEIKAKKANLFEPGNLAKTIFSTGSIAEAKGKLVGDILVCLLVPAVLRVQQAGDRAEQTQTNLQTAFALAAYQRDHGSYPKKLDALTPKYLDSVPEDFFTGKELIYRPIEKGYLFYSVGVNGRDDEGRSYEDEPRGDDLPVRMPLPKWRE